MSLWFNLYLFPWQLKKGIEHLFIYTMCIFYGSVCLNLLPTFLLDCSPFSYCLLPAASCIEPLDRIQAQLKFTATPSPPVSRQPPISLFPCPKFSTIPCLQTLVMGMLFHLPYPSSQTCPGVLPQRILPSSHIYHGRITHLLCAPIIPKRPCWLSIHLLPLPPNK